MALFSQSRMASETARSYLQFKAGKMNLTGTTVKADDRKGFVYVHKGDDGLMHFCWRARDKTDAEDDLIVFPDEVVCKKVEKCTTGRVFILLFKDSSRKYFFWMQEPNQLKDEGLIKKLNDYVNGKTPSSASRMPRGLQFSASDQSSLHEELRALGLDENTLQEYLMDYSPSSRAENRTRGGRRSTRERDIENALAPPAPTDPEVASSTNAAAVELADLQRALESAQQAAGSVPADIDMSNAISRTSLLPLFQNEALMKRLQAFLPESELFTRNDYEVVETITSPAFRQALREFNEAFATGQLGPLLKEFGFSNEIVNIAATGDFEKFAQALIADEKKQKEDGTKAKSGADKNDEKKDDDEDMALD